LKGEAARCVSGLALTAANYPVAEWIIFAHLEGLLQTPVLPATRSAKDFWRLCDRIQSHVRSLETLGVTGEQYGVVLTPLLLSRLPEDLRMEWARDGVDRESDLAFLMRFLQKQVERKERAEAFVSTLAPEKEKLQRPRTSPQLQQQQPSTASALSAPSADRYTCAVCGAGKHTTKDCHHFAQAPIEERWDKVCEARLCFACLGDGHRCETCNRRCSDCRGRHHRLLCKKVPQPPIDPPQEPLPAAVADPAVSAPSFAASERSASLQTAVVTVQCPDGRRVTAMALLDSGADRCYVSRGFANKVRPTYFGHTCIRYAPFGSSAPAAVDSTLYNFTFIDVCDVPFDMIFCEIPIICSPLRRAGIPASQIKALETLGVGPLADAFGEHRNVEIDQSQRVDVYWTVMSSRS
jgi:hypothetical protein